MILRLAGLALVLTSCGSGAVASGFSGVAAPASTVTPTASCRRALEDASSTVALDAETDLKVRDQVMALPGVRGYHLLTSGQQIVVVAPGFAPPTTGWAANLGVTVQVSCVPDRLISVAQRTVDEFGKSQSSGITTVAYNSTLDVIRIMTTTDAAHLLALITNAYGEWFDAHDTAISPLATGGPAAEPALSSATATATEVP